MLKKLGLGVAASIALLTVTAIVRTIVMTPSAGEAVSAPQVDMVAAQDMAQRLSDAIQIATVSWGDERSSEDAFVVFHDFLDDTYPAAHRVLERTIINGQSLIYRWPGEDETARPVALAAHMDVVPVETGTEEGWDYPPFSGAIEDGIVWGRGALDDKGSLIAIMEVVENLAAAGHRPTRDIYFLFGHDEEVGGPEGAAAIVEHLREKGVQFEWVLDEGSAPVKNLIPGQDGIVALISVGEKGSTTLELTATAAGGHSSTPGPDTAASIVARAAAKITDNPYPAKIDRNITAFLHAIAAGQPFSKRLALYNLWLTGPMVKATLEKDPVTAASMRTTTALTILSSGTKVNVLPQQARALVNYRIHPRDTPESVLARAVKIVDDPRVEISVAGANPASEMSAADSPGYNMIENAIVTAHGDVIIAPSLTLQGTDLRHYGKIADDAYRFFPFVVEPEDLGRIHGTGERIEIENLARGVTFYKSLLSDQ